MNNENLLVLESHSSKSTIYMVGLQNVGYKKVKHPRKEVNY